MIVIWRITKQKHAAEAFSGEGPKRFGARWSEFGGRRFREQTAIAGAFVGMKHGCLSFEAEDRTVHHRDLQVKRGVVDEIPRREIVAPIHDEVPTMKNIQRVR